VAGCSVEPATHEDISDSASALGVEVASCSQAANSGYSTTTSNLTIAMGSVTSLVLGVVNGYVTINGYPCVKPTAGGGGKITPTMVKKVSITGTSGDDKIVIDTLSGPLGAMVSQAGGISIDMAGEGTNGDSFSLRGANSVDKWTAGEDISANLFFEVSGDKFADIVVKSAEVVAVGLGGGSDSFTAQGGAITSTHLAGGSASALVAATVDLTVNGGDGDDVITGGAGDDTVNGGNGNDTFKAVASDGDDTFNGGAGTDKADYSANGADLVVTMDGTTDSGDTGGGEKDIIGADVEDLLGGAGDDTLTGNDLSNHIQGGAGADIISGGTANSDCTKDLDILDGEAGNDTFDAGSAADCGDLMNGGAGTDRVDYQARSANLKISLDTAANDGDDAAVEKDNVKPDVEIVISGSGDDIVTGSPNADTLHGGPGDDVINGGAGNDTLTGDSGNDTLNGEAGNDTFAEGGVDAEYTTTENAGDDDDIMNGGTHDASGLDTVDYSARTADVTATICMDASKLTGGLTGTPSGQCADQDGETGEADQVINVTHMKGGTGDDDLSGAAADDTLEGGDGDDSLAGGAGSDTLYGDDGDDTLTGDAGDDYLDGGASTNGDDLDGDNGTVSSDGDVCISNASDTVANCEL
jgi:Ca2+-binding RTX toxin-like protein